MAAITITGNLAAYSTPPTGADAISQNLKSELGRLAALFTDANKHETLIIAVQRCQNELDYIRAAVIGGQVT